MDVSAASAASASAASVTARPLEATSQLLALSRPSAGSARAAGFAGVAASVRPAVPVPAPMAGSVRHRQLWEFGDDAALAPVFAGLAGDLVRAAGVTPMHRVLDVGAGSGNAAIAAAQAGADVVASDLVPALLERGRLAADARGITLEWLPADAQRLPFDADTFDVVLSCVGVMFAPDPVAAARELVRVCRPGGTLAIASWTADGAMGRLFALLDRHAPIHEGVPPTGPAASVSSVASAASAASAVWGDPARVRALFADSGVRRLSTHHRTARLDFGGSPAQWCALYRESFAPVVEAYERIGPVPKRVAALDAALLRFATDEYLGPLGGPGRYEFEYLLLLAEPR
ncbi:class I SAM-dependent methyltransferase [Frankia sp. R82]|uniref:class I SAM-dependent methyltransferase n=1 Tax=Frankia sp. R82 TaxID=2950553 RepID=UPI002044A802|nr:class I SAM-dependent methyltransferase [Frankia sp. R82]MCM3884280.1 class I SAM-dependent methyltransferase [Frankia sp. R82]